MQNYEVKEFIKKFIKKFMDYDFLRRDLDGGIHETELIPNGGFSVGCSYETGENGEPIYVYNLFFMSECGYEDGEFVHGGEYINIAGFGTEDDPLPDDVVDEIVNTLYYYKYLFDTGRELVMETCPHCGYETEMMWSVKADGFKAFCPKCGKRLMLCDECLHRENGECINDCDYCSMTDSCKFNKEGNRDVFERIKNSKE